MSKAIIGAEFSTEINETREADGAGFALVLPAKIEEATDPSRSRELDAMSVPVNQIESKRYPASSIQTIPTPHTRTKYSVAEVNQLTFPAKPTRHRLGLPPDFVKRAARYGRSVLLQDNVYRLPDGAEFIPQRPTGTLGGRHIYTLLTKEQYVERQRSSVYVRSDGRIFDYGFDHDNPIREMFDTGYTIYDLERTGSYAPDIGKASHNRGGKLIRKLTSGKYRLYSKKKDPKTGKRKNLGTFNTRKAAEKHERAVQYFKSK
jgi:hypothetical protein